MSYRDHSHADVAVTVDRQGDIRTPSVRICAQQDAVKSCEACVTHASPRVLLLLGWGGNCYVAVRSAGS
jgi:hypothetical protein